MFTLRETLIPNSSRWTQCNLTYNNFLAFAHVMTTSHSSEYNVSVQRRIQKSETSKTEL